MKRLVIVAAAIIILTSSIGPAYAQDSATLDAGEFWARLEQTRRLTEQALEQEGDPRTAILLRLDALWADVQSVRLDNELVIPVDVSWLRLGGETSNEDLYTLGDRITALLRFQRERYGGWTSESMLAALDDVLQDVRFRYEDDRPNAIEEPDSSSAPSGDSAGSSSGELFTPSLAQLILMVIGIVAVMLFASSLLRALQVQPAAAESNGNDDDVPPTSSAAHDRADDALTSGDYRAAIRYLYLASLLLLDERGVIRFDASLTNVEHVRQITDQAQVRGLLEHIVGIFDRVWYGFAPVDDRLFRQFQHLLDQLQQATKPA